jgi:hypothetical protein
MWLNIFGVKLEGSSPPAPAHQTVIPDIYWKRVLGIKLLFLALRHPRNKGLVNTSLWRGCSSSDPKILPFGNYSKKRPSSIALGGTSGPKWAKPYDQIVHAALPHTPLRHISRDISRSPSATDKKPFSQGGWRDHGGAEVMMYVVDMH